MALLKNEAKMIINGVIEKKLSRMESYLDKLISKKSATFEQYSQNWELQLLSERILQILIEIVIDISDRIISLKEWGPASSSAEALKILHKKRVISEAEPYISMIGFRNFIVHNYDDVDPSIVYGIITKKLNCFRSFKKEILRFVDTESEPS